VCGGCPTKQYLAAVRPQGDVLTLETMVVADEVRDPSSELDQLPLEAHAIRLEPSAGRRDQ
jgi:DNA end-binding protein Ku